VRETSAFSPKSVTRLIATRDRERCLLIVSLSDQSLIALECGGLTPLFERECEHDSRDKRDQQRKHARHSGNGETHARIGIIY
jgi:hypothetical protein